MSQPNEETLSMALEIADQQVRADIETFCTVVTMDRVDWYDTTMIDTTGAASLILFDKRYIELRGQVLPYRVIQHPLFTNLYRFEEKPE